MKREAEFIIRLSIKCGDVHSAERRVTYNRGDFRRFTMRSPRDVIHDSSERVAMKSCRGALDNLKLLQVQWRELNQREIHIHTSERRYTVDEGFGVPAVQPMKPDDGRPEPGCGHLRYDAGDF